jgi:hypothetical protein
MDAGARQATADGAGLAGNVPSTVHRLDLHPLLKACVSMLSDWGGHSRLGAIAPVRHSCRHPPPRLRHISSLGEQGASSCHGQQTAGFRINQMLQVAGTIVSIAL